MARRVQSLRMLQLCGWQPEGRPALGLRAPRAPSALSSAPHSCHLQRHPVLPPHPPSAPIAPDLREIVAIPQTSLPAPLNPAPVSPSRFLPNLRAPAQEASRPRAGGCIPAPPGTVVGCAARTRVPAEGRVENWTAFSAPFPVPWLRAVSAGGGPLLLWLTLLLSLWPGSTPRSPSSTR